MSKASDRQAAFVEEVQSVVKQAHQAADEASTSLAAALRNADGHILGSCGWAGVVLFKPSYRLRKALKTLGEVESRIDGRWMLRGPWTAIRELYFGIEEAGAKAAADVLNAAFPNDGSFFARTRID